MKKSFEEEDHLPIPCLKVKLHLLCQRPNICGTVGLAIDVTIVFGLFRGQMMNP